MLSFVIKLKTCYRVELRISDVKGVNIEKKVKYVKVDSDT